MIQVRKSADRGRANFGWLDSSHSFSFGHYHDPAHMGFSDLRVINEDVVIGGRGFDTHGHRDMEIVTYVLDGALEHRDSLGTRVVIRPGEVQRMTAGPGVRHSEYNASATDPVHLLQIWILPGRQGLTPGYEQKLFPDAEKRGRLRLVASPDGRDGSVMIHQDASLYASVLATGDRVRHVLAPGRQAWLQVARGSVVLNGAALAQGDGAAITGESEIEIAGDGAAAGAGSPAEVLLFDLAP